MELVTGKRPIEPEFGNYKDIVYWVCNQTRSQESLFNIVDPSISNACKEDAIKVLKIATHCTGKFPVMRPSMRAVVQMLEEAAPQSRKLFWAKKVRTVVVLVLIKSWSLVHPLALILYQSEEKYYFYVIVIKTVIPGAILFYVYC